QLMRADPVLRVGRKPDRRKPLIEPERGVLEDRSDLDRKLPLTGLALPVAAGRQVVRLAGFAARTDGTFGPAQLGDVLSRHVWIGAVADGFEEVFGLLLHTGDSTTSPVVCQVYRYPN